MSSTKIKHKKELTEQSGKFIGVLQQALTDALQKKAGEITDKDGVDLAYWRFTVTLKMEELAGNLTDVLKTTVIESKDL